MRVEADGVVLASLQLQAVRGSEEEAAPRGDHLLLEHPLELAKLGVVSAGLHPPQFEGQLRTELLSREAGGR